MNSRIVRIILGWNVVLTLLLLGSAAANVASVQASNDPPIRVFTANTQLAGGAGAGQATDILINGTTNSTIADVEIQLPAAKPHICFGFASAEAEHQSGQGLYWFNLLRNGVSPTAAQRRIELIDNGGIQDPKYKEVSTLNTWPNQTGTVTFSFVARKDSAGDSDIKVTNATLSVICVKKQLDK